MTDRVGGYHYRVVRRLGGPGRADVALVRSSGSDGVLKHLRHQHTDDSVVLAHRTFRPMFDLAEMEAYAAQLERAAAHGNDGTLGCFVTTEQQDGGIVRVSLYERWLEGQRLRCERLAQRDFDASAPDAIVASAEFLTELQAWAADRNDERDSRSVAMAEEDRARTERANEQADSAKQLAEILQSHRVGP